MVWVVFIDAKYYLEEIPQNNLLYQLPNTTVWGRLFLFPARQSPIEEVVKRFHWISTQATNDHPVSLNFSNRLYVGPAKVFCNILAVISENRCVLVVILLQRTFNSWSKSSGGFVQDRIVVGVKDKILHRQFLGAEKNYINRKAELELQWTIWL
jgi:hypothetical protein